MKINAIELSGDFYVFSNPTLNNDNHPKYEYNIDQIDHKVTNPLVLRIGNEFKGKVIEALSGGNTTYHVTTVDNDPNIKKKRDQKRFNYSIREANQYDAMFGKPELTEGENN